MSWFPFVLFGAFILGIVLVLASSVVRIVGIALTVVAFILLALYLADKHD